MGGKSRFIIWVAGLGIVAFGLSLSWQQAVVHAPISTPTTTNQTAAKNAANSTSAASTSQSKTPPNQGTSPSDTDIVTVKSPIGTIPPTDIGVNTAVWDPHLLDKSTQKLLQQAGIHVLRFPGGSVADTYHWQTNSIDASGDSYAYPQNSFANFSSMTQKVGARALITVNYGTGSPQEAAAWVRNADVQHNYDVAYWEIGNEVFGNGTYGTKWEADNHPNLGPQAYGKNALKYIRAMKKADPQIKVGVDIVAPGQWPDGQQPNWNRSVLKQVGKDIDFIDVHWYPQQPGQESDEGLLNSPSTIPGMMAKLHALIQQYCGGNAANVKILVSETNSVTEQPGKQTVSMVNGLFLANDVMTWLQQGAVGVDWWDLHNAPNTNGNNASALYGTANYGNYGILSSGSTGGNGNNSQTGNGANGGNQSSSSAGTEPPLNTPFPTYYALKLLSLLGQPGDTMLQTSGTNPLISTHAVKRKNGTIAVLLINNDGKQSHRVTVDFNNFKAFPITITHSYGPQNKHIAFGLARRTVTLKPYSMKVVVFHKWP